MIAWFPGPLQNLLRHQKTIGNIFILEEKDKNKRAFFFNDSLSRKLPFRQVLTLWATLIFLYPQIERSAFLAAPFLSMLPAVMVTCWKVGIRKSSATQREGLQTDCIKWLLPMRQGTVVSCSFSPQHSVQNLSMIVFIWWWAFFTWLGFFQHCFSVFPFPSPSKVKETTLFHSGSFVSFPEEVLQHLEHDVQQLVTVGALSVFFSPLFILYNFSS